MRLMDRIVQRNQQPLFAGSDGGQLIRLASPCDWSDQLRKCPFRYVLSDQLVAVCAALAFSDGDRLVDCLDLVRIPSEALWVEWDDAARSHGITAGEAARMGLSSVGRAGAYITAKQSGRVGVIRSFWAPPSGGNPLLAAFETHCFLDGVSVPDRRPQDSLVGAFVAVRATQDPALDTLLSCARFRLEPTWARYYSHASLSEAAKLEAVNSNLGTVARDLPVLLAFFLLMSARGGLPQTEVSRARINMKRRARHHEALLNHIEVQAPVWSAPPGRPATDVASVGWRRPPRFHHVRGHLVRRANRIFWRVPHVRGSAARGTVRSRTVRWEFAKTKRNAMTGGYST